MLIVITSLTSKAYKYDFNVDDIYYTISPFEDVVAVTSGDNKYSGNVIIPDSVSYEGIVYRVTGIENLAFRRCKNLTSVKIPPTVIAVGAEAFYGCTLLTSIHIPSSVKFIGRAAFENTGWYNNQPNGILYLDKCCLGYKGINKQKRISIAAGTRVIGYGAFNNCKELTSVNIPNSVKSIGARAFNGCEGLTSITIPNSVTSIGFSAFDGCSGLTYVTIPNSVTSIGNYAFDGCSGLASLTIPNSVTSIGSSAFDGCSGLTSLTIPNSVKSIGCNAFRDTKWYYNQPDGILYLDNCCLGYKGEQPTGSLNITNGTRLIGDRAFYDCSGLISISIPNTIETIGEDAFVNTGWYNQQPDGVLYIDNCCLGYKGTKPTGELKIAEGTKVIALSAFADCENVTSVIVPHSVRFLKVGTFEKYKGLVTILPSKRDMEKIDILKIPGVNIQDKYSIPISKNYSLSNVSKKKKKK